MATPKLLHVRSTVQGKLPAAGAIQVGQIGINYNAADPFLCIKDSANTVRRLGGTSTSATAPTAPQNGQLWVDVTTPTAPVLKVWDGSNWVVATGGTKASAVQPTTAAAGDLWVDVSGTAPVLKVYNGTTWNPVHTAPASASDSAAGVVQLATDAEATAGTATNRAVTPAQLKANVPTVAAATVTKAGIVQLADGVAITAGTAGRIVDAAQLKAAAPADASTTVKGVVQLADAAAITAGTAGRVVDAAQLKAAQAAASGSSTAPAAPTAGQVWVDSSVTPAVIKVWSGTAWIPQAGATVTSATAPTAPTAGQVWVDTSAAPNVTKIWDGTKWVTATPDGAATAALANDAKYATKAELATENTWDRTGTSLAPAKVGDVVNISAGTAALPGLTPVGDPNTGVWSPGADQLGISTNGAERLRITSAGKVGIGVTAPTAAGGILQLNGGITFPATQVASTDPNTLDDYEEGTHTATLTPSGSGSITLDTRYQTLTYTKVGRLVSLRGTLIASSSSSPVGYVTVSLPFTPAVVSGIGYAGGSVFVDAATGVNVNEFVMIIAAGGARIYLGDNTVLQSDSAQAIASAGQVYLEMNYHV
jgi:hypothetical protein